MLRYNRSLARQPLRLKLACGIALSLSAMPDAFALDPAPEPPQVVVRYDDLNLSTEVGAAALLHRLELAARQVCGDSGARQPLTRLRTTQRCDARSLERAIAAVNLPQLTLAYRSKYLGVTRTAAIRTTG